MTDMDKKVLDFLKEWLAWAEDGGPDHEAFKRWNGLCCASNEWGGSREFGNHFREKVLKGNGRPFGRDDYEDRFIRETQHECPKRLAWVRAKIEELTKGTE